MTTFHFIAGLPRSGSTLLAAILQQNPRITTGIISPVSVMVAAMQRAVSSNNEAAIFISEAQRERLLRGVFTEYYSGADVVFDTNRTWPARLPLLTRLFPDCRVICCVRDIALVMNSLEQLLQAYPLELSRMFKFEADTTVFSRVQTLRTTGVVGFALDALRDGFYGPHSDRLLLVDYELLAMFPGVVMDAVYDWTKLPRFKHDFNNVEQIPGAAEFDLRFGLPGLHRVRRKVEFVHPVRILPWDLFKSLPHSFWEKKGHNVAMVARSEPQLTAVRS